MNVTLDHYISLVQSLRAFSVPQGQPMSESRFRQLQEAWSYMLANSRQPIRTYQGRYVVMLSKSEAHDLNIPTPDYIPFFATAPFRIEDPVYDDSVPGSIRMGLVQMDRWLDPSLWERRALVVPRISLERG